MVALRERVSLLASDSLRSLLVVGETGVGKDLVPRALYAASGHLSGPLEVFNCPAVPADHLESELFGTTRGAYPGALDRPGAAERARDGLLFLDEIAAMPLAHQGKALRLLECGEGRRLGASGSYRVRVAFVAATNEDLGPAVSSGRFREDLYYRLVQDGIIRVAPLRERREDVELLADLFLAELSSRVELSGEALARLRAHHWPGNVRELRAVTRAAARLAKGNTIAAADVVLALGEVALVRLDHSPAAGSAAGQASFHASTRELRRKLLVDALAAARGNRTLAGVLLGLHRGQWAPPANEGTVVDVDVRARKRAHRMFEYWWRRLIEASP